MIAKFDVKMLDYDGETSARMYLPFVPFPGLNIQCPFDSMNYRKVGEVFWREDENRFYIYLEDFKK